MYTTWEVYIHWSDNAYSDAVYQLKDSEVRNAQYSGREKKVLTRVRRIRGQIDALERALENGAECRAILQQIAAVRGASNGLMAEVLESHIRETFDQNDSYSHEVSKSVDDTIELVRAYLK